jgi:hypothetical protein
MLACGVINYPILPPSTKVGANSLSQLKADLLGNVFFLVS